VEVHGPPKRVFAIKREKLKVFTEVFATLTTRKNAWHGIEKLSQ
jgi:hypothetical protein